MSIELLAARFNTTPYEINTILEPVLESFQLSLQQFDTYTSKPKALPRKLLQLTKCFCTENLHYTVLLSNQTDGPALVGTHHFSRNNRRLITHIVIGYLRVVQHRWVHEIPPRHGLGALHCGPARPQTQNMPAVSFFKNNNLLS
jgi:hypothetical protein